MAHTTLNHYLQQVDTSLKRKRGQQAAELLSFRDAHIANPRLQLENPESQCEQWFEPPIDELVAAHIKSIWCVSNHDFAQAYGYQSVVVHTKYWNELSMDHPRTEVLCVAYDRAADFKSFIKEFQSHKEENWALPIMYAITVDLRLFANSAELQLSKKGKGKPGEVLEKAADTMMACFRICAADNRASVQDSKKWGMLYLINQLFKIYFKINKLHLCKPLIRAIESSNLKEKFSISQLVTYRYYVGRKAMFDSDFKSAETYLSFAFRRCHKSCKQNKRLILMYLLPVKMLLGHMPRITVLKKYDLMQFADIAKATSEGNLHLLERTMAEHEGFFIKSGVYLILEKLKTITYRNLFKKVFLMMKTHIVPIDAFLTALKFMDQEDVDSDEVQCIIANLIYKNYIKGYLSHQHNKLVVSKQNAFPPLASFL